MEHASRRTRGALLLILGVLALSLAASFEALGLLNVRTIYNESEGIQGYAATTRHPVLLIVIDGLREDAARSMPSLRRVAQQGASARLLADFPTFSAAAYVTLLSGTGPSSSGRRTNQSLFAAAIDSVPGRLSGEGRTARVLSDEVDWWGTLLPRGFSEVKVLPTPQLAALAERWMAESDLLVVHLCGVDEAGHSQGASSAAYREAILRADEVVARLAERWNGRGVLSIVSDHGHLPPGGHGGAEDEVRNTWWVASGPGVAAHRGTVARATDVAPTLAAWLGVPSPAHAEGNTRLELIDAPPSALEELRLQDTERVTRLERAREETRRAWSDRRDRERWGRTALVGVIGLAIGWLLRGTWRPVLAGSLAGAIALAAAASTNGLIWGPPSFSAASAPGYIALRSALLLLVSLTAIVPWLSRRQRDVAGRRLLLLGVAGVGALPAAALFVFEGAFAERALLPDPIVAALPLQLWPMAGAGALFALVAWISGGHAPRSARAERSDRRQPG